TPLDTAASGAAIGGRIAGFAHYRGSRAGRDRYTPYMRRLAAVVLTLFGASLLTAENWPQFRGPSSVGVSAEKDLPVRWSGEEGVAWKAAVAGLGVSSPIVWGDRVFVTSQLGASPVSGG